MEPVVSRRGVVGPQVGPARRAPSGRRRVAVIVAALGSVVVLAYAIPAIALAGEVPRGTRIGGVDVGGLSEAEARTRLEREFGARLARPLTLSAAGKSIRRTPSELGIGVDVPASVEAALDGASTPAGVVRSLFGSGRRELRPRIALDEARLTGELAKLARTVDAKPREGGVRYKGTQPQPIVPKAGRVLDRAGAADTIRDTFLSGGSSVTLTTRSRPPATSPDEVRRITGGLARTAVAGPLALVNGGQSAELSGSQVAGALRWAADGRGGLRPVLNAKDLLPDLNKQLIDESQRPQDASFKIVKGKPQVIPARPGRGIDAKGLGTAISTALAAGRRSVKVPVTETQPRVTTALARKLGIKKKVSSFTTHHPCCAPRVTNIHRIADIVDGYVVKPGETFSLNGIVGKRDKARGFVEAPMILNNRFVNDVGGGVSQFATTMFNAVFFGGFEDVQHRPHQYYISRYPAGRESTVSYPQPDFRWRNDSPYGVLIKTSYTSTSVTVEFWSTQRFTIESETSPRYDVKSFDTLSETDPDCIPMEGAEGFSIDVWRIFRQGGKEVRKQKYHTVYAPEPRLKCT
ncbi:VanW family protein [Nonomuraea sp. 10N515B]|uniref:VanW family protein n=1 Tax=Nonomuraea sp. 10N515B TaxID=3457422 RepID=UPI003FCE696F